MDVDELDEHCPLRITSMVMMSIKIMKTMNMMMLILGCFPTRPTGILAAKRPWAASICWMAGLPEAAKLFELIQHSKPCQVCQDVHKHVDPLCLAPAYDITHLGDAHVSPAWLDTRPICRAKQLAAICCIIAWVVGLLNCC